MFQTLDLNIWKGKIFLFNTNVFLKFADLEDFSYWGLIFLSGKDGGNRAKDENIKSGGS